MIEERIDALRKEMSEIGVDAWFITGFTGSAGTVIITKDKALLWVDSRYFLQGAQQIEGTDIVLMKLDTDGTPEP